LTGAARNGLRALPDFTPAQKDAGCEVLGLATAAVR